MNGTILDGLQKRKWNNLQQKESKREREILNVQELYIWETLLNLMKIENHHTQMCVC